MASSNGDIRVFPTLHFHPERERDLIDKVNKLNNTRSFSNLISNLLRVAFESPDALKGDREYLGELAKQLVECGMMPERDKFFRKIEKQVEEMKNKVDEIYNIAFKTYTMAQCGNTLGLLGKSENSLMATFILERQLKLLSQSLGVDSIRTIFASDKLEKVKDKADGVMEYIIESYGSILSEMKRESAPAASATSDTQKLLSELIEVLKSGVPSVVYQPASNNSPQAAQSNKSTDNQSDTLDKSQYDDEVVEISVKKPKNSFEGDKIQVEVDDMLLGMLN